MNLGKLEILKKRMAEATDFTEPFTYFLDHFGDKDEFLEIGKRVSHPKLEQMLNVAAALLLRTPKPRVENCLFIRIPKRWFIHGGCRVNGRVANFIYFEDIQLGLLSVLPETPDGMTLLERFSARDLPPGWVPSKN
jgi:hypothetical protein